VANIKMPQRHEDTKLHKEFLIETPSPIKAEGVSY
jgi:hypothetical protein